MRRGAGMVQRIAPGVVLRTPAYQPCVCGKQLRRDSETGVLWYTPCCQVTYLVDEVGRNEIVWLGMPQPPRRRVVVRRFLQSLAEIPAIPTGMTTALYRRYDSAGILLYVGISDNLPSRSRWHERHSPWAPMAAHLTVEWFASRPAAESAETTAIRTEWPLFNRSRSTAEARLALTQYLRSPDGLELVTDEQDQK